MCIFIYPNSYDCLIACGFNARIGNANDFIVGIDNIEPCVIIDNCDTLKTVNYV